MIIPVTKLPSNFKPYPFKSFKMKAMTLQQAIDLNDSPSLKDIADLIQKLSDDTIDASKLVPVDLKYLLALLSFNAYPNQKWTLDVKCPHCNATHKQYVTVKDFPPIPSFSDEDPYPLTIDDGTHVYSIGYPSIEATDKIIGTLNKEGEDALSGASKYIDLVEPYILSIDGSTEGIREKLLDIQDFSLLNYIIEAITKFFNEDTYGEFKCPKCTETYKVPMSAVEVTQYTPFLDKETTGKYKTNFRL